MRLVWSNELGGETFEVGGRFLKWAPASMGVDLRDEAARMQWAAAYTPVPRVIDAGASADGSWLFTERLPGENAVTDRWKAEPATAVRAIGEGLRAFHDALPVDDCPFSWRIADRLPIAESRKHDPSRWEEEHQSLTVADALAIVRDPPPEDHLVVGHGDPCSPNTLIGDDGRWTGHVDLGRLGVADRWSDLAIATWATTWNYGPGWERPLLDAYGVAYDAEAAERTRYYRVLWDLMP